jgi:RNA polymerase sigma-70 factor (ECF subfamily)
VPDVAGPSDEELVHRVRAGDEAAARLLFERHLPALRAKAHARLPRALRGKVAESDVIQDAWLAAFLSLGDFEDRGDGSFAAWLRQILDHKLLDGVRRHARVARRDARREVRLATQSRDGAPAPALPQASPSGQVAAAEESAALRAVVGGLPEDQRMVVRLVHEEELSLVEAGARMGRSADAARMLYSRALSRLSRLLGPARDADA